MFAVCCLTSDLRQALARYQPIVEQSSLPRGMLHADIFPDNTLFDEETGRLAVIDWEVGLAELLCSCLTVA